MGLTNDDKDSKGDQPAPNPPKAAVDASDATPKSVWIFGYGSLIWKTNFPFQKKMIGFVKGYVRRFWQGSILHRGTQDSPGRVATLVKSEHGCTWGIAYQVDPHDVPEVMNYLNKREAGGYTTHEMEFYSNESIKQDFIVLTYIGTESNPNYIGPEPAEASAKIIVKSQGASGSNIEYVLELEKAMKEIAPHIVDEHLQDITKNIKQLSNKI